MPDNDPNAFYDVAPAPQGRLGFWMVTSHGIPWRFFTDRDKAVRFATDAAWRAETYAAEALQCSVTPRRTNG